MRKKLLTTCLVLASCATMYAGDLVTNTNQNVTFLRNPARDASTEIDAAYTNPAGLAFLKGDNKLFFSLNNQSAFQTRTITSTFGVPGITPFAGFGGDATKEFKGKASAPFVPNLQAAYKTGKWVFSANIGIVGGGGTLDFSKGLPSFESQAAMIPVMLAGIGTTQYSLNSGLKGTQIIYGVQLGATYKINDNLSAYLGARASFVSNNYTGYIHDIMANVGGGNLMNVSQFFSGTASSLQPLIDNGVGGLTLNQLVTMGFLPQDQFAKLTAGLGAGSENMTAKAVQDVLYQNGAQTADKDLNCKQNASGVAPIIGFDYHWNGLNIGVKYEFKTAITLKNKTTAFPDGMDNLDAFKDGVSVPNDIPAMLSIGAKYDIIKPLTVSVGYHHFFDSNARMVDTNNQYKQQYINGGVNEYLAGLEYRINKMFLVSCGTQITRPGLKDEYFSDMSFDVNSVSFGIGGAIDITKNIRVNLAYLITNYSDRDISFPNYYNTSLPGKNTYSRTNHCFGIGVDFSF